MSLRRQIERRARPGWLEPARADWLDEMEALSRVRALERARELELLAITKASTMAKDSPADGERSETKTTPILYGETVVEASSWHLARANGVVQKWDRIRRCKDSEHYLESRCACSGKVSTFRLGCGQRECPKCRAQQAKQLTKEIDRARHALRNEARARHADRTVRERLLTLTAPHYGRGTVTLKDGQLSEEMAPDRRRIAVIFEAWRLFSKWLKSHWTESHPQFAETENGKSLVQHFRVFEWTEGDDGQGHPHFHVWLHSPWLAQEKCHEHWQRCLATASGEARTVSLPDIRAIRESGRTTTLDGKPSEIARELVKYMLKDLSNSRAGAFVSAVTASNVLWELDGRRRRQTSVGLAWWAALRAVKPRCDCCGCEYSFGHSERPSQAPPEPARQKPPDWQALAPPEPAPLLSPWLQLTLPR